MGDENKWQEDPRLEQALPERAAYAVMTAELRQITERQAPYSFAAHWLASKLVDGALLELIKYPDGEVIMRDVVTAFTPMFDRAANKAGLLPARDAMRLLIVDLANEYEETACPVSVAMALCVSCYATRWEAAAKEFFDAGQFFEAQMALMRAKVMQGQALAHVEMYNAIRAAEDDEEELEEGPLDDPGVPASAEAPVT